MNTYAIGDIHGCLNSLQALAGAVQFDASDQIIFLGDYIDRGADSKGVIDWIIELGTTHNVIRLRGNHEEMMLEAKHKPLEAKMWSSFGGFETLISYNSESADNWIPSIPGSHWGFLKSTRNYLETDECIFVHGAVEAALEMKEQDPNTLLWGRCHGMRPHASGKRVVCGHTPQDGDRPGVYDFGVCIDTGAYKGGWLTCLNPSTGDYWQADESGDTRGGSIG